MNRFEFTVFKRFWEVSKLYWLGDERKNALGLLLILVVLLFANTQVKVLLNTQQGNLISALAARDSARFSQVVFWGVAGIIIFGFLNSGYGYLRKTIGLYWRRWLTYYLLKKYFSNRAFYTLNHYHQEIDNPDQRISGDVDSFCQESLDFLVNIIESVFIVISFSLILWSISKSLVFSLIIYSILAYTITINGYGRKLTKLHSAQLRKEADFRFALVRIRENAESIAFYNSVFQENNKVKLIFDILFKNFQNLLLWSEIYFNIFKQQFGNLPWLIPPLILANQILSGQVEVGKVTEASGAFGQVAFSVNLIMYRFDKFTNFAASINRLYIFYEYLKQPKEKRANDTTIDVVIDNRLAVENLTVETPNSQKVLYENLSFSLLKGQGLLIMGESGCGKSSLLRVLAGLWNSGTGVVIRSELKEILFLPQRPYMILGTLREQLLYTNPKNNIRDEELYQILQTVKLSHLGDLLSVEKTWNDFLSLGEQQRLAFARILLRKPKYAILDEATSALDVHNEEHLYRLLLETGTTFISVGHRPNLKKYHEIIITLP